MHKINAVGNIQLHFNAQNAFSLNYWPHGENFPALPKTETFWFGSSANNKVVAHFTQKLTVAPVNWTYQDSSNMVNDSNAMLHDAYNTTIMSNADFNKLIAARGTDPSVKISNQVSFGLHYKPTDNSSIMSWFMNEGSNIAPIDPVTHLAMSENGGTGLIRYSPRINGTSVANNLTLQQLRDQNADNTLLVSRQSDGSYNVWARMDVQRITAADIHTYINDVSFYPLISGHSADSIEKAMDDFYLNGTLQGRMPWTYFDINAVTADSSIPNTMNVTRYNNDLNPIETNLVAKQKVASSMAHGQAAVKLHVINATNGTELNQWSKLMSRARNKKNSSQ